MSGEPDYEAAGQRACEEAEPDPVGKVGIDELDLLAALALSLETHADSPRARAIARALTGDVS